MPIPSSFAIFVPIIKMKPRPFPDYPYLIGPFGSEREAESFLGADRVGLYPIMRLFAPYDMALGGGPFSASPHDDPSLVRED